MPQHLQSPHPSQFLVIPYQRRQINHAFETGMIKHSFINQSINQSINWRFPISVILKGTRKCVDS